MFNWKDKRVLVTGALGMIGIELYEQLIDLGAEVTIADLKNGDDLTDYQTCRNLCIAKDYVFHLAGIKGSPKMTKERPIDFMAPMISFDRNMIVASQEVNVKRFLYTSSIAVEHPEQDKYPAWAKMTGEKLIEAMRIQYPEGTKYCIVRPANVYGRYDNFNNPNAMVITSLIKQALDGKIKMYGNGHQVRDFINAKDVARGMIKAMEGMPMIPVNLCSGVGVSIKRIVDLIAKYSECDIEHILLTNQIIGDKRRVMRRNWNNPLTINIEDGIKEVLEYAKENTK